MTTNLRCICAGAGILFVLLAAAAFRPDAIDALRGKTAHHILTGDVQ
jgi:hypothetical protein